VSASTITGGGSVVGADLKKTLVELPTSANLDFVLDPQGLVAAFKEDGGSDGEPVDLSKITPSGTIEMVSNVGAAFINMSSFPVQVEVSATLTGQAISTTSANVTSNTANNAALDIIVSAGVVDDENKTDDFAAHSTPVVAIEQLGSVAQTANFALLKSEYTVTQSGTAPNYTYSSALKTGEAGDGSKIQLDGTINHNANWSAYMGADATRSIGVSIVFNVFELAPAGALEDLEAVEAQMVLVANLTTNAYRLLNSTGVGALAPAKASSALTFTPAVGFGPLSGLIISGNTATLTISRAVVGTNDAFLVPFGFGAGNYTITPTFISATGASAAPFASKATGGIAIQLATIAGWGTDTPNPIIITLNSSPTAAYTLNIVFTA
jgi:uncharacterized protein YdeI (BOF family)